MLQGENWIALTINSLIPPDLIQVSGAQRGYDNVLRWQM
jgi:hypothetical protein